MKHLLRTKEPERFQLNTAKRLLTIHSYIEKYYNINLHETGPLDGKYRKSFHLGLVLMTYDNLFGFQVHPRPYAVYARLMDRDRSSGHHWYRRAEGYLDVYRPVREEYETFLKENEEDILKDCKESLEMKGPNYIKVIRQVDEKKLAKHETTA